MAFVPFFNNVTRETGGEKQRYVSYEPKGHVVCLQPEIITYLFLLPLWNIPIKIFNWDPKIRIDSTVLMEYLWYPHIRFAKKNAGQPIATPQGK